MKLSKEFWDTLRPMFNGSFSDGQFDGVQRITTALSRSGLPATQAAYCLATAHHETGRRMQPVREGFAKTDAGAIKAVTSLFNRGIIRVNYALPDPITGKSYYGRGLIQITWKDNYLKAQNKFNGVDFVNNPDMVMEWQYTIPLLIRGMEEGMYRKSAKRPATLKRYIRPEFQNYTTYLAQCIKARNIVNGDVRKNGQRIAEYSAVYYNALMEA